MRDELLTDDMKADLREMTPDGRAWLREMFLGHPHYQEVIEYLDKLAAEGFQRSERQS